MSGHERSKSTEKCWCGFWRFMCMYHLCWWPSPVLNWNNFICHIILHGIPLYNTKLQYERRDWGRGFNKKMFFFNFSDMVAERNAMMEHCYPKLKDFCREKYGIEFQVNYFILLPCTSAQFWTNSLSIGFMFGCRIWFDMDIFRYLLVGKMYKYNSTSMGIKSNILTQNWWNIFNQY